MKFAFNMISADHGAYAEVSKFYVCKNALRLFGTPYPHQLFIQTKKKEGYHKVNLRIKVDNDMLDVEWKCPSVGKTKWDECDISLARWLMQNNIFIDRHGYLTSKAKIWIKFADD